MFFKLLLRIYKLFKIKSPVFYVNSGESLPPPLGKEEEEKLLRELSEGNEAVKQTLIEHNIRLVVYIARKFENTGINIEDLVSIGTIGLIKAVNTFCPEKNIKLATYASRCIENEILMHLRKTSKQKLEISIALYIIFFCSSSAISSITVSSGIANISPSNNSFPS